MAGEDQELSCVPDYVKALITGVLTVPSEGDLAHLLAIVADERAQALRTLVWLIQDSSRATLQMERLWRLAVAAGTEHEGAFGVLSALQVEEDLGALKSAMANGRNWSDPAEILDPNGERGVEIRCLLCLAQHQLVEKSSRHEGNEVLNGHALDQTVVRLFQNLDEIEKDKKQESELDS